MTISNLKSQISKFISSKYFTVLLLSIILLLGAFFRFYRISEYLTFLGDEGRDVLVVKRMLVDHKFTLLGPITSVGSMYMGPIYYYFMAPFLWAWNFSPVGPAVMVVLFALATIYLIYKLGSEFINPAVGITASFFYSISPLAITSGRASWNPNVVPFFAVLLVYGLLKVIVKRRYKWFAVVGLSLGVLLQLHYVTFLFIPVILACLFLIRFRIPVRGYIGALLAFLASYSPFLLFELRHQFVNSRAVIGFVARQNAASGAPFMEQFWNVTTDVFTRLFWRLLIVDSAEIAKLFIVVLVAALVIYYKKYLKQKEDKLTFKVIIIWLLVGMASFGIYRGVIYDYYFGSLFPVPFLLSGIMLFTLWKYAKATRILSVFIFLAICYFFFKNSPLYISPSNLLANTRQIAEFVYKIKGDKPYNFALIAGRNSDHAYRYFLEVWGQPPVVIENQVTDPNRKTVTDQLLVVCEEKVCQPLGHPLWEIAGFGRAEIAGQWTVVTAQVFKLVHYKNN